MKKELIIRREDRTQFRLTCELLIDSLRDTFEYRVHCMYRGAGKRKWQYLPDSMPSYRITALSYEDRQNYNYHNMLNYVSEKEIQKVKDLVWNSIKP